MSGGSQSSNAVPPVEIDSRSPSISGAEVRPHVGTARRLRRQEHSDNQFMALHASIADATVVDAKRTVRPSGEDVCSVSRSPVPPGSLVPMSNTLLVHAEGRATRPPPCQGDLHLLPMAACVSSGRIAAELRGRDACHLALPVHERTIRQLPPDLSIAWHPHGALKP